MPARPPPIPREQRSFKGQKPHVERDAEPRPAANPKTQGDEANIRQNVQPQRQVQDR